MGLTHAAEAGAVLKGFARARHAGRLALEGGWLQDPVEVWAALHGEMVVAWVVAMMGAGVRTSGELDNSRGVGSVDC